MAQEEIPHLEKRVHDLEQKVQIEVLPPDENDERDAIVEIPRQLFNGSEAAILPPICIDFPTPLRRNCGFED